MLVGEHHLPVQQACRVVRLSRTAYYRPPVSASRRDASVIATLTDVVARYPRWGFWKLFDRLRVDATSSLSAKSPFRAQFPPVIDGALTVCAGAPRVSSAP